jgi:hypothetical protein
MTANSNQPMSQLPFLYMDEFPAPDPAPSCAVCGAQEGHQHLNNCIAYLNEHARFLDQRALALDLRTLRQSERLTRLEQAAERIAQRLDQHQEPNLSKINGLYQERAIILRAFAIAAAGCGCAVYRGIDLLGETGFDTVLFIELPSGQVSWHLSDEDADLVAFVPLRLDAAWDEHDTEQKIARLLRTGFPLWAGAPGPDGSIPMDDGSQIEALYGGSVHEAV